MEKRIEKRAIEVVSKFFHDISHNQGLSRARYFLFNPGRATSCYEFNYAEEAKEVFHLEKVELKKKEAQAHMLKINDIDSVYTRVNQLVSQTIPFIRAQEIVAYLYFHGRTHLKDRVIQYQEQKVLNEIAADFETAISDFAKTCNFEGQAAIDRELYTVIIPELE